MQLKEAAQSVSKAHSAAYTLSAQKQNELNHIFYKAERSLIQQAGLPRRPWYKHQIYAPGFYTGYGVKTLPYIREAIEQRNWEEAQAGIEVVSQTIQAFTQQAARAAALLKQPT